MRVLVSQRESGVVWVLRKMRPILSCMCCVGAQVEVICAFQVPPGRVMSVLALWISLPFRSDSHARSDSHSIRTPIPFGLTVGLTVGLPFHSDSHARSIRIPFQSDSHERSECNSIPRNATLHSFPQRGLKSNQRDGTQRAPGLDGTRPKEHPRRMNDLKSQLTRSKWDPN